MSSMHKKKKTVGLETYLNHGFGCLLQEDWKGVVANYKAAATCSPFHDSCGAWYYEIGKAYEALGQIDKAIDAFSKYLHRHPGCALGYASRGNLLQTVHQIQAAKDDFQKYELLRGGTKKTLLAGVASTVEEEDLKERNEVQSMKKWQKEWAKYERTNLQTQLMMAELEIQKITYKLTAFQRTLELVQRFRMKQKRQNDHLKRKLHVLKHELAVPKVEPLYCVVCLTNQRNIMFNNCHHVVCCSDCLKSLRQCPICRKNIWSVVTVFLS